MPEPAPKRIADGDGDITASEIVKAEAPGAIEPELPPVTPPSTKAPVQFNQQVNVYQIPPSAWDRLSPEQVVELSKVIVQQIDVADKRQFDYVIEQNKSECEGKKMAVICGCLVSLGGFSGTVFLAMHSHELIALSIALPLATILAVVVGNRFLD